MFPTAPHVYYCLQLATGEAEVSPFNWYFQQLRGFFVPPVNATYQFFIIADEYGRVYLSKNASSTGEAMVASQTAACDDFFCQPSQLSTPVHLVANQPYWFRATHQATGGGSVNIGVRIVASSNPTAVAALQSPEQSAWAAVPAVLALRISTPQTRASWSLHVSGSLAGGYSTTTRAYKLCCTRA